MAYIRDKDQRILWGRAAGMYSLCTVRLTFEDAAGESATVGEMCHIIGEKEGAARYDSNLTDYKFPNYCLCCSCF